MARATLGIAYTSQGGSDYNFVLDNFGDFGYPRSFVSDATFERSASGVFVLGGTSFRQKYQWVVSSVMKEFDAQSFQVMFQLWDADRADGYNAALGIEDRTFGGTVTADAIIVTPPSFTRMGPGLTMVSFGLQEV